MSPKSTWFRNIDDAALKGILAEHARKDPTAARSGKPDFVFVRPPGPVTIWPIDDPCQGQDWVWPPDMAVKAFTVNPVTNAPECPSDADLTAIKQALPTFLKRFRLPNPDVRVKCQGSPPALFISIWGTQVQPGSCDDQARQNAQDAFGDPSQDKLQDITAGGTFGIYISASLISTIAQKVFDALPKTLDGNGAPNPDGSIHLTALGVIFPTTDDINNGANHFIKTFVNGYDDQVWPSVHFTTTFTDNLGVSLDADPGCGQRQCISTSDTSYSTNVDILSDVLLAVLTVAFPYLLVRDISALFNLPHPPAQGGGVGCGIYGALPDDIPLPSPLPVVRPPLAISAGIDGVRPHKKKIHLCYARARADSRGLLVSATQKLEDRTPGVEISGPERLVMDANAGSTFGLYSAETHDFFGDPSFTWSGGGPDTPNAATTRIVFSNGAKPGESLQETITVRVTDVEGSAVTASLTVSVYVSPVQLPPYCKDRPWLKQCRPLE
jgi:hypothetical protein